MERTLVLLKPSTVMRGLIGEVTSRFEKKGLRIVGPDKDAAQLEGSTSFAKDFMKRHGLPTAKAEYFDNADLLISADCVAHAYGSFHRELLDGRILIIFCPKLDTDIDGYVEKLSQIFQRHDIKSITVARMEVPCCGGTVMIVKKALELAGKDIPLKTAIVGIDGSPQD